MPGGMDSERTSEACVPGETASNPLVPETEVSYAWGNGL